MPYTAPVDEFRFILDHVVPFDEVAATERFEEATPDMVAAILTEAGRLDGGRARVRAVARELRSER